MRETLCQCVERGEQQAIGIFRMPFTPRTFFHGAWTGASWGTDAPIDLIVEVAEDEQFARVVASTNERALSEADYTRRVLVVECARTEPTGIGSQTRKAAEVAWAAQERRLQPLAGCRFGLRLSAVRTFVGGAERRPPIVG